MRITWMLVNCNSTTEAERIGKIALTKHYASCFDIFHRHSASFFWPPKTGKIERAKGALLILETLPSFVKRLQKLITANHSDKLPFIGSIVVNVSAPYKNWVANELQ